jgi:uncharacterized protein (DUF1697 family)
MTVKAKRYAILLRGINVGGHAKVPMARLREVCEELGLEDVATYVQSGNVVARSTLAPGKLSTALEQALEAEFGFAPTVVVRQHADLVRIVDANPYPETEERFLHVGFMTKAPTKQALADLGDIDVSPEHYMIAGAEIYLDYVNGAGRSPKLGKIGFEKRLGVGITARNLRTVQRLVEMSGPRETRAVSGTADVHGARSPHRR